MFLFIEKNSPTNGVHGLFHFALFLFSIHPTAVWALHKEFSDFILISVLAAYLGFQVVFRLPHWFYVLSVLVSRLFLHPAFTFWSASGFSLMNPLFSIYSFPLISCFRAVITTKQD